MSAATMNQPQSQDTYIGPRQSNQSQSNARMLPANSNQPLRPSMNSDSLPESNLDRAARYEDEKKRIIESCFSKKEDDGIAAESYITHVRVVEDGAYPSNPPPPESAAANKKGRIIIVAVRKSGRVRVHKARENPTGTFSIGKTWPLEDLSSIQSYTHLVPRNPSEQMEKQWADGIGFVVTLGKPYYWQAPTSKEKDFFIGSLVKIYRKYTGGKTPELFGFASHEVELLTGAPATPNLQFPSQTSPIPAQTVLPPPPIPASSERRPQSPQSFRSQGSDQTGRAQTQSHNEQMPPARDAQRPPPIEPLRSTVRNEDYQQNRDIRNQRSLDGATKTQTTDQLSSTPAYLLATNPHPSPSPQSSQHSLYAGKTNGRALNGTARAHQSQHAEDQQSASTSTHTFGSRPSTAVSDQRSFEPKSDKSLTTADSPPDRRKQFLGKSEAHLLPKSGAASETNSQFATPAASPSDLQVEKISNAPPNGVAQAAHPSNVQKENDYFHRDKQLAPDHNTNLDQTNNVPVVHESPLSTRLDSVRNEGETPLMPRMPEEEHRPGLGPMFKKKSAKDIAGQFRKAAIAASAFQPRQGGAGARLKALQDKDKISNEPDGITSVVPAPLLRGISSDTGKSSLPATPTPTISPEPTSSPAAIDVGPKMQVQRNAIEDTVVAPDVPPVLPVASLPQDSVSEIRSPSPEKARSRSPQRKRRQRQEAEISKYCSSLDINPRVFEGRGADFNDLLTEFGWEGKLTGSRTIENFEAEIKREIGRAQATGWLGHVEQQEGKVIELANCFDHAIEECEELDGLFTLYSHELDTLAADIEYIEAQSQGLQVQTANQKLLQNELNNLLRTLTISSTDLRGLQSGSLNSASGIESIEKCLALLYKALTTIDPDIRQNKVKQTVSSSPERGGIGVYADTEIGQMRAVQERKDQYRGVTVSFVQRYNQHMAGMFKGIDETLLYESRQQLWKYNAMMLFVREVNSYEWQTLITSYEMNLKGTYQTQFREHTMNQRKAVRKPGAEELDALFTTLEKEKSDETLASTAARKLTVKRGKTVKAGALRQQLGEKRDGKLDAYEVFGAVLKHQCNTIAEEQNFVSRFFHLNSQANADFAEIITSKSPDQRKLPNLMAKQPYDPDRNMAKIVQNVIDGIYSFWLSDLQNLLDWAVSMDSLQGVGVLTAMEQCLAIYEETNQEYITRTIRTLHDRLTSLYHKFVDEQIRAIEETKVKIKKRKGIISFMRTFPVFSATIEQMIPADMSSHDTLEVRFIVNDSYSKILKAMWESLSFIAKDDPAAGGATHSTAPTSGDPEDKEALNYHILLIENMNHYLEEVETGNIVLDEWADKARQDFTSHLTQYTDSVIRRPLGKWLDFLESTETMMKNSEAGGISGKPSHSRSAARKVLSSYDGKEIKKGIETLKKRIEKHFGDVDDPSTTSKALILRAFAECNTRYAHAHDRMSLIIKKVYEGSLDIDWRKEEVAAIFKR